MKPKEMLLRAGHFISAKSPAILTGCAVAGFVATIIFVRSAAKKEKELIDVAKEEFEKEGISEEEQKSLKKDLAIEVAKIYAPAAACALTTVGCIIFANVAGERKRAALAAAYSLSESALKEYQEKSKELLGEKKDREIRDAIAKDKFEKNPPKEDKIIFTGDGDYLCMDAITGRYFKSNINKIQKAVNEYNAQLMSEMWLSLNEFYDKINIPHVQIGEDIGWSVDSMLDLMESYHAGEDGTPCLVMDFRVLPTVVRDRY